MSAKKRSGSRGTHARKAVEFRFKIDAYSPETMPMARLASYMAPLAAVLGEPAAVHLVGFEEGSTVLKLHVEREASPKVRERVKGIRAGVAPRDALTGYEQINRLLREDDAVGVLRERRNGPRVLEFPGKRESEETFAGVRQHGMIDGIVNKVGGTGELIRVILEAEGKSIVGCYSDRRTAKALAVRLFEPVRLYGLGSWSRNADGEWELRSFHIQSFEALSSDSIAAIVAQSGSLELNWNEETLDELEEVRHGRTGNGRS